MLVATSVEGQGKRIAEQPFPGHGMVTDDLAQARTGQDLAGAWRSVSYSGWQTLAGSGTGRDELFTA